MALASLLGGQKPQPTVKALAHRFSVATSTVWAFGTAYPWDMAAPILPNTAPEIPVYREGPPHVLLAGVAVVAPSSSQSGFSPSQAAKPPMPVAAEGSDHLYRQTLPGNVERVSAPDLSTSKPRIDEDRLPYVALIRGMLDRDQVIAARALLSVALTELPSAPELLRAAAVLAVPKSARRSVRDVERTNEYSWLTSHAAAYRGKWVAVVGNELIASAGSLKELLQSLKSSGRESEPLIHRVD
jgi:hypothetical protein